MLPERGDAILYVPSHADGDVHHKDCEVGFVTSVDPARDIAWCRYFHREFPHNLRTIANSEATPIANLRITGKHRVPEGM